MLNSTQGVPEKVRWTCHVVFQQSENARTDALVFVLTRSIKIGWNTQVRILSHLLIPVYFYYQPMIEL
jgi:hypothetical protein